MSKSSLSILTNSAKNTFNLLKDWQTSKDNEDDYYQQADSLLKQTQYETKKIKRENREKKGESIANAGASGIAVSSFNDALLYNDLKTAQEVYQKQEQAREQAYNLRKQAKKESRNRKNQAFSYSIGLLTDFGGLNR